MSEPELSIVIAIIAGGQEVITTCLQALEASAREHSVECIVPYDDRLDRVVELAERFPWVEFLDARPDIDASRFGDSSREHHDILRSIGLRRARGRIVALLEDHGTPSTGWIATVLEAHRHPAVAVGGAVENGVDRLLNWAVYYCDFGRYQNPVQDGPSEFLSDSNVSYKREALASVKDLWFDAFHETSVNGELRRRGGILKIDSRMVVYQTRRKLRFFQAVHERYVWGRSFAGTRAREITGMRRVIFASFSFLLPAALSFRIVSRALHTRRYLNRLLLSMPLVVVLETIWSLGEFIGYLTGHTGGPRQEPARATPHEREQSADALNLDSNVPLN